MMKRKPGKFCHLSRRQALAMVGGGTIVSGLAPSPVKMLIQGLVEGIVRKAQADQSRAVQPRRYVNIHFGGGPQRWAWDQLLAPYPGQSVPPTSMVNSCFDSSGGPNAGIPVYKTFAASVGGVTLNLPPLWATAIPRPDGSTVPMTNLLQNMLIIRGVLSPSDGHELNFARQTRPSASAPSIGGQVADQSTAPVPAAALSQASQWQYYASTNGTGQAVVDAMSDPLRAVLGPFDQSGVTFPATFLSRRQAMAQAMNDGLAMLAQYARAANPGAELLYGQRTAAETQLQKGIGDVEAMYAPLLAKYQGLIRQVAAAPAAGFTDKPVPYDSLSSAQDFTGPSGSRVHVQAGVQGSCAFAGNPDLTTIIGANSTISTMAESFAVAEFLLTQGYSSTVLLAASNAANLYFLNTFDGQGNSLGDQAGSGIWNWDEHTAGSATSLIIHSFFYRSLSACLYEFISQLRTANLFDETVIHLAADFPRNPQGNDFGTGHGWQANMGTILSGAVQAPLVLGNTMTDPVYHSNWGQAAPLKVDGVTQPLTVGHLSSTICSLLRVAPLMPNSGSLVEEPQNGGLIPTVELAKVDGS